jgi:endonuclease V-like protein UPF0215 family
MIKEEARVLGIACVALRTRHDVFTHVVGVVYRGKRWLEGVTRTVVPEEESYLTSAIADMTVKSPHYPQLQVIILDELTVRRGVRIEIEELSRKTGLPVIAVLSRKMSTRRVRARRIAKRGPLRGDLNSPYIEWSGAGRVIFAYFAGLKQNDAKEYLRISTSKEGIPEATRVARAVCSSIAELVDEGTHDIARSSPSSVRSFV